MEHLYKVDADKAFKILLATTPGVVFINGPRFSERAEFVERFKSENVNVMILDILYQRLAKKSIQTVEEIRDYFSECTPSVEKTDLEDLLVEELHTYLNRSRDPCIISGDLGNVKLIQRIFERPFTYVYVYPTSAEKYKESIVACIETCEKDPDAIDAFSKLAVKHGKKSFSKSLDAYVDHHMSQRKKIFKSHKEFLGRALVILDKSN